MTAEDIFSLVRGSERLLITISGALAIYLGYRLFRLGIFESQSALVKTDSMQLKIAKVGPGIFFALFGTYLLLQVLSSPLAIGGNADRREFSYLGSDVGEALSSVQALNTIIEIGDLSVDEALQPHQRADLSDSAALLIAVRDELRLVNIGAASLSLWRTHGDAFMTNPDSIDLETRKKIERIQPWFADVTEAVSR